MPEKPREELPPVDPVGEHVYQSFRAAGLSGEEAHGALEGVRRIAGENIIATIHEWRVEQRAEQREQRAEQREQRAEQRAELRELRAEQRAEQREQRAETQKLAATQQTEAEALRAEIRSLRWMIGAILILLTILASAVVAIGVAVLVDRPEPTAPAVAEQAVAMPDSVAAATETDMEDASAGSP